MAELGTNWKAFVIQFIPAILGSGVFVSTIISSYSEFYNKPNIEIAILPDQDTGTKTSIILSNKGTVPATDLKLVAIMPKNIRYVDSFSLERITVRNESNMLEVMMPRLVHGEGSVTTLNLMAQEPTSAANDAYQVYAIYDQGSTKGRVYRSIFEVELSGIRTPLQLLILGSLITAALVIYIIILPRLLGYRYNKKVSGWVNSVYTKYIKSKKSVDDKVTALVELQEIINYLDKRFYFKIMTRKTREELFKLITDPFNRILSDVDKLMLTSNMDISLYKKDLKESLRKVSNQLDNDILVKIIKKIDDHVV